MNTKHNKVISWLRNDYSNIQTDKNVIIKRTWGTAVIDKVKAQNNKIEGVYPTLDNYDYCVPPL